mmetsp:Transcript_75680/g.234994  ORF Transcript_75680/g.234994 Transcript_75680/m.234994 type:complete len:212 (+) Transcript_75680:258-893(+)
MQSEQSTRRAPPLASSQRRVSGSSGSPKGSGRKSRSPGFPAGARAPCAASSALALASAVCRARGRTSGRSVQSTFQPSAKATKALTGARPQPSATAAPAAPAPGRASARCSPSTSSEYQSWPAVQYSSWSVGSAAVCATLKARPGKQERLTGSCWRCVGLRTILRDGGLGTIAASESESEPAPCAPWRPGHQRACASRLAAGSRPPHALQT